MFVVCSVNCVHSGKFDACVTDRTNTKTYVRHLTPFKNKPVKFFKVNHGNAVLDIPVSSIARIVVTDREHDLCTIVLKDNRTFFKKDQKGFSWVGKNEFGGSFFIKWQDWRKIEFLK